MTLQKIRELISRMASYIVLIRGIDQIDTEEIDAVKKQTDTAKEEIDYLRLELKKHILELQKIEAKLKKREQGKEQELTIEELALIKDELEITTEELKIIKHEIAQNLDELRLGKKALEVWKKEFPEFVITKMSTYI